MCKVVRGVRAAMSGKFCSCGSVLKSLVVTLSCELWMVLSEDLLLSNEKRCSRRNTAFGIASESVVALDGRVTILKTRVFRNFWMNVSVD